MKKIFLFLLTLTLAIPFTWGQTVDPDLTKVTAVITHDTLLTVTVDATAAKTFKQAIHYTVGEWDDPRRDSIRKVVIVPGVDSTIIPETDLSELFYNFTSLVTIEGLVYLNTEDVTRMYSMFDDCQSLTSLSLSQFNTENVTSMGSMFYGCQSLTSLDLSQFNTEKAFNMHGMFYDCSILHSLNLSSLNTSNVKYFTNMFQNCDSLSYVAIGDSITSNISNQIIALAGHPHYIMGWEREIDNFQSLNIPLNNGYAVAGSYTSYKIESLSRLKATIEDTILTVSHDANGTHLKAAIHGAAHTDSIRELIKKVVIKESSSGDKVIPESNLSDLFSDFITLDSITGLDNLNTENVTNMSNMFEGCYFLTSLDLSSFNTENVTDMRSMFEGCSSLTSLDF